MSHIDEGQIHAYLDRQLEFAETEARERLEAHVSECAQCAALVEQERSFHGRAAAVLQQSEPELVETPAFDDIVARATDRSQSVSVKKLNRTRSLAWAASIAVAVTVGWYARFSVSGPSPNVQTLAELQEPQVALSRNEVPQADAAADADEAKTGVAGAVQPTPTPTAPARERDQVSSAVQEAARPGFREGAVVAAGVEREAERAVSAGRRDAPAERQQRLVADQLAAAADSAAQRGGDSIVPVVAQAELRARRVVGQNRPAVAGAPAFSDDEAWTDLTLQEAERRVGRRILIVEGLEILRVSIASVAPNAPVRVVQRLPSGDSLEIVQQPLAELDRVAGVLQARAELVKADEMTDDARTVSTLSVARGNVLLTLRAPVAQDSLQALSSRLRESPSTN